MMKGPGVPVKGSVALVTGANRGIGLAFTRMLLDRGASRVYAAVRDPASVTDPDVVPVRLDVTDRTGVLEVAAALPEVNVVINNAGIATAGRPLTVELAKVRKDFEVNVVGPLSVAQAFAPVLAANGGGALVNMLSVMSWVTVPPMSAYAASKAAAWSMTNALRQQLRAQHTLVVGVYSDTVDTDMTDGLPGRKNTPEQVVRAALDAVEAGAPEALVDEHTRAVKAALPDDQRLLYGDGG